MIFESQFRLMASIIISEYQFPLCILVLVRITDYFNFIFSIDIYSNAQNRPIDQINSCICYSLFCRYYLFLNINRFSKTIVVDFSYRLVKRIKVITERHVQYSLMQSNAHSGVLRVCTHQPIRHIPASIPCINHCVYCVYRVCSVIASVAFGHTDNRQLRKS